MITYFIGHLHPVLLHLPIGLFSVALIAFYFHPDKSFRLSKQLNFMLLITSISALISTITGWLLGHSGDYQEEAVRMHQWTAIAFTLLNAMVYFLHRDSLEKNKIHLSFQPLLIISFLLMMYTGHEGGSLTHGDGFLWLEPSPTQSMELKKDLSNASGISEKNLLVESKSQTSLPDLPMPDSVSLDALIVAGFTVRPIATGSGWLDVSAVNLSSLSDTAFDRLVALSAHIHGLNLSGLQLTENQIRQVVKLKQIRRLDLRNTGIGDPSLRHIAQLNQLEYLNLVGTMISDNGLQQINNIKTLKNIYCWNTSVTATGKNNFKIKNPEVSIDLGFNGPDD